jgi:hypothetical protein
LCDRLRYRYSLARRHGLELPALAGPAELEWILVRVAEGEAGTAEPRLAEVFRAVGLLG